MATDRRVAWHLFLVFWGLYLLTASFRIDSADGEARFWVACNLVSQGRVSIPYVGSQTVAYGPRGEVEPGGGYGEGAWGRDGRYFAKYGLGWSLAAAPLCALGLLAGHWLGGGAFLWPLARLAVMGLNPILTAGSVALLFLLLRRWYAVHTALFLSVAYGAGTIAWYYARSAFSEPLVVLCLLLAWWALLQERRRWLALALAAMVLTRQTALLLALPLVAWPAWQWAFHGDRRSRLTLLWAGGGLLSGQTGVWLYNLWRFGSPLDAGYRGIHWDTPLGVGLYGQWLSPGKGLLVFMPLLLLGLLGWPRFFRRAPAVGGLLAATVGLFSLPQAAFNHWNGGGGWGLRLLLPLVPLLLLPAGEVVVRWRQHGWGRLALAALLAFSIGIQLLGISVHWGRHLQRVWDASASPAEYNQRIYFSWADSPLWGQVLSLREVLALNRDPQQRARLQALVRQAQGTLWRDRWSEAWGLLAYNVPDHWLVYGWYLGVPFGLLSGLAAALGIGWGWSVLSLRRLVRAAALEEGK